LIGIAPAFPPVASVSHHNKETLTQHKGGKAQGSILEGGGLVHRRGMVGGFFNTSKKMENDFSVIEQLLVVQNDLLIFQNQRLDNLLILGCLIFGSLLFVHFGRFVRW